MYVSTQYWERGYQNSFPLSLELSSEAVITRPLHKHFSTTQGTTLQPGMKEQV